MIDSQAINCVQENGFLVILMSGLVSALVSLIVYFIKEGTKSKRDYKEQNKQLLENYIDPLIVALDSLHRRLKEMIDTECLYFENNIKDNVYLDYKRKSTLYRLCVVFGQIYLLKHEKRFTVLSRIYKDLDLQIENFRSVLADGSWLDMLNTQRIFDLIKETDFDKKPIRDLSIKIENLMFKTLYNANHDDLGSLSTKEKSAFIEKLCSLLDTSVPDDISIQDQIIRILDCRGVFILRDMQDDIGLKMLRLDERDKSSMIGYTEFSEMLDNPMFLRVRKLFEAIDFEELWKNIDDPQVYTRHYTIIKLEEEVGSILAYLRKNKYYKKSKKAKAQNHFYDDDSIRKEIQERYDKISK